MSNSVTLGQMERDIRYILGAQNLTTGDLSPDAIVACFGRALRFVQAETDSSPQLTTTFLALVANTYSYSVASNPFVDVSSFNAFRLAETGRSLERVNMTRLLELRDTNPDRPGTPYCIAFVEAAAGTYTAYVYPTPDQSYTVQATYVLVPGAVDDLISSGGSAYDGTMNFAGFGYEAALYTAAAELATDSRLSLSADRKKKLEMQAARMVRAESSRVAGMLRQSGVVLRNPL